MAHSNTDRLKTLKRRADHLAKRIEKEAQKGKDLSYDRSEESALRWAIEHLEACLAGEEVENGPCP